MRTTIDLQLSLMANGAIQEKLDGELQKVFENIHDLNTEAKKKRTLTIKLDFVPDDNRQVISLTSDFAVKLAPVEGVVTTVLTGKNGNGKIEAKEMKSNQPGQLFFDPEDGQLKTDVGEPVDAVEKEQQNTIIDLQKKRG
jgi:hypothetical protein